MTYGVNRWTGIGNMTADPEMKQGSTESSDRTEFAIAINKPPGRDSERESPPTYIDLVAWGKLAQQVSEYGRKGRLVYVEGEIEVRKWETDEGEKRKQVRVKAWVVRFLDKARDDDSGDRRDSRRDEGRSESRERRPSSKAADFEDLPF